MTTDRQAELARRREYEAGRDASPIAGPFTRIVWPVSDERNERLVSTCVACGVAYTMPNKGLGRASVAAWESRHECEVATA